jgi:hypothetical protein
MTATRPALRRVVDLAPAQPAPRWTWQGEKDERHTANLIEAHELLEATLGPISAMTPRGAFARGELAVAIAKALTGAEERGDEPRVVPELIRVFDYPEGSTPPPDPADGGVIDPADYDEPQHGLMCPHCGEVTWDGEDSGIYVIDRATRYSRFGYEVRMEAPMTWDEKARRWFKEPGEVEVHLVTGSYGDGDYHSIGYACESCERRVALPDGVEEQGD